MKSKIALGIFVTVLCAWLVAPIMRIIHTYPPVNLPTERGAQRVAVVLGAKTRGDTMSNVLRAASLAGLVQCLAAWFQTDRPFAPVEDDYLVYSYNRFQACRFGLDAVYVDPATGEHLPLREHLLATMDRLAPFATQNDATGALASLRQVVTDDRNDARWLRERQSREHLLGEVIRQASLRFRHG